MKHERPPRKTSANLTINASLIDDARALGINLSQAAEAGIAAALKAERESRWKEENRAAIEEHNAYIEKHGLPLAKFRMFKLGKV